MELPSQITGLITSLIDITLSNPVFTIIAAILSAFASMIVPNKSNNAFMTIVAVIQRTIVAFILFPFVYVSMMFMWGIIQAQQWQTLGTILIMVIVVILIVRGSKS